MRKQTANILKLQIFKICEEIKHPHARMFYRKVKKIINKIPPSRRILPIFSRIEDIEHFIYGKT